MIEDTVIQGRGFHNIVTDDGEITGFQFCMSTRYYRGLWLSQFRAGNIIVDGVEYGKDVVTWELYGKEYTVDQMHTEGKIRWQLPDLATVKVKKPGGLSQGYHEVTVSFAYVNNYIAPDNWNPKYGGVNFKGFEHKKTLIIV
jgi:hypothetical protein